MISFIDGYYGWLGNQMFQFAATKALALHRGTEASFPQNRPNLHQVFRLDALPKLKYQAAPARYTEPHFHYDPVFWDQPDNTELQGYFQSARYFSRWSTQIREAFALVEPADGRWVPDGGWEGNEWVSHERVSIHVRRGDYLNLKDHHPPLGMDYYRAAMDLFPGERFVVFSDDTGWCRENFDARLCEFAEGTAVEDLERMTHCSNHIIANSSFSWWGAWLGKNPDKKVVAPKRWFGPAKAGWDTKDLLPEEWIKC